MRWPLDNFTVTQGFSAAHLGVDLAAPEGTDIKAPEAGVVIAVNNVAKNYFGGLYIKMRGDSGYVHYMGHNSKNLVSAGSRVTEGQVIGKVGMTVGPGGTATGPHVHFEMSKDGKMLDARTAIAQSQKGDDEEEMITITPHKRLVQAIFGRYPTKEEIERDVNKVSANQAIMNLYNWAKKNKKDLGSIVAAQDAEIAKLKAQIKKNDTKAPDSIVVDGVTYVRK